MREVICRTDAFKYSFFPYAISECNKLDLQTHKVNCLLKMLVSSQLML